MSLTCAKDAPYLFFQSLRGSALGIDVGSCKESQTADIDHHIVTDHHVLRNYPAECWDSLADSFFKDFSAFGTIALDVCNLGIRSYLFWMRHFLQRILNRGGQARLCARRSRL